MLDEVLFKVFLWTAREHFNIQTKAYAKLKKNSELAKKVAQMADWIKIEDFFSIFSVVEPTQKDLWKSIHYSREFGVFGNDALSLCLMKRLNLTYIATADKDFAIVSWLKLVKGDWIGAGTIEKISNIDSQH